MVVVVAAVAVAAAAGVEEAKSKQLDLFIKKRSVFAERFFMTLPESTRGAGRLLR